MVSHQGRLTSQNSQNNIHIKSNIHVYTAKRKLRGGANNEAKDFVAIGAVDLEWLGTFENWWKNCAYKHSTAEEWDGSTTTTQPQ